MDYTKNQLDVINNKDINLLVSAGAGSGKTSVLTAHVIKRIIEDKIDIDKMLIVTFTRAAAHEMSERIFDAIEKALENDPSNLFLRRQLSLVSNANISTIDSFLSKVVKDNFNLIDIEPNYRMVSEGEERLLKQDAFDKFIEKKFSSKDSDFYDVYETYFPNLDKKGMLNSFDELFSKVQSFSKPIKYIEDLISSLRTDYDEVDEVDSIKEYIEQMLKEPLTEALLDMEEYISVFSDEKLKGLISEDMALVRSIIDSKNVEELAFSCTQKFPRLCGKDKDEKDEYKTYRDALKKTIEKFSKSFAVNFKNSLFAINKSNEALKKYLIIFKEFYEFYQNEKREGGVVDFGDISHYALEILLKDDVKEYYRNYFEEIMIDEYQDTNELQDSIFSSIAKDNNIFLVGDVKQSIYKFRNASPSIFLSKYKNYSDGKSGRKIDLVENFRSRESVCNSVNEIFSKIMTEKFSGIDYEKDASLKYGADKIYTEGNTEDYKSELVYIGSEISSHPNLAHEARFVASKIKELVDPKDGLTIYDKNAKLFRKATFKDIAILDSQLSKSTNIFIRELDKAGIPAVTTKSDGYFDSPEIKLIISMLKVIDNPRQDIDLAAVMLSPLFDFTNDEIALIKANSNDYSDFYDALLKCSDEKVKDFITTLNNYRKIAKTTSILELINIILNDTGYGEYISALPYGDIRLSNIEMIKEIAREYELSSYSGLFDFNRYISNLIKYEIKAEEASVLSEESNVVKLLTIHASKGLEYPIVFLVDTNRPYRDRGSKIYYYDNFEKDIKMTASHYFDISSKTKFNNVVVSAIQYYNKIDERNEELRKLYVALTRAREKLFVVGSGKLLDVPKKKDKLSNYELVSASSMFDYIWKAYPSKYFNIHRITGSSIEALKVEKDLSSKLTKADIISSDKSIDTGFDFSFDYKNEASHKIKSTYAISELKKLSDAVFIEGEAQREREFKYSGNADGALIGSAYHLVFEKINVEDGTDADAVKKLINSLTSKGLIEPKISNKLNPTSISAFFGSEIGKRVIEASRAGKLYREKPFVLGIEPSIIDMDSKDDDKVIIQGVIDMFFEEDDGLVLIDYKSDNIKEGEEQVLRDRYSKQLEYYKMAIERAFDKKLKIMYLYSIRTNKFIEVKD